MPRELERKKKLKKKRRILLNYGHKITNNYMIKAIHSDKVINYTHNILSLYIWRVEISKIIIIIILIN